MKKCCLESSWRTGRARPSAIRGGQARARGYWLFPDLLDTSAETWGGDDKVFDGGFFKVHFGAVLYAVLCQSVPTYLSYDSDFESGYEGIGPLPIDAQNLVAVDLANGGDLRRQQVPSGGRSHPWRLPLPPPLKGHWMPSCLRLS